MTKQYIYMREKVEKKKHQKHRKLGLSFVVYIFNKLCEIN